MGNNNNIKRKNVKRVDRLLQTNAALNATLGKDSTHAERVDVKREIRANIKKMKDLCPYIYGIISLDDNHKSSND